MFSELTTSLLWRKKNHPGCTKCRQSQQEELIPVFTSIKKKTKRKKKLTGLIDN